MTVCVCGTAVCVFVCVCMYLCVCVCVCVRVGGCGVVYMRRVWRKWWTVVWAELGRKCGGGVSQSGCGGRGNEGWLVG